MKTSHLSIVGKFAMAFSVIAGNPAIKWQENRQLVAVSTRVVTAGLWVCFNQELQAFSPPSIGHPHDIYSGLQ
jgi:hypothetical protein